MLQKLAWKIWDMRCFKTYMKYALKPVNSEDPEGPVRIKTSKVDAATSWTRLGVMLQRFGKLHTL
ncbi:hypothetical protein BDV98DRAFT_599113 [Pterulicium gracile]|uniref:Uncharacterized protein n=1 Tax=Pterulicium gracile TaxID=1884261 RepID=A0A5C3PZW0_9AGAR|nr:hypothetical protein BDV98DRAFT_599113 [Pterula gracilis]